MRNIYARNTSRGIERGARGQCFVRHLFNPPLEIKLTLNTSELFGVQVLFYLSCF